jgi:hypothetical protein
MIRGWDSYWDIPVIVTDTVIRNTIAQASQRFFDVKINNDKYVVFREKDEYRTTLPPSIQFLYPVIQEVVYSTLNGTTLDVCYTGNHELVFLMIMSVIQRMDQYTRRKVVVYTYLPEIQSFANAASTGFEMIGIRFLGYPNMAEEDRHVRVDQLTNYTIRHMHPLYVTPGSTISHVNGQYHFRNDGISSVTDVLRQLLPLKSDMPLFNLTSSTMNIPPHHLCMLIMAFPKFGVTVQADRLVSLLIQYALDRDMIVKLDYESDRTHPLCPLTIPSSTQSLDSVCFYYLPRSENGQLCVACKPEDFDPVIQSLEARVTPLRIVSLMTRGKTDDVDHSYHLFTKLVSMARVTRSIGCIYHKIELFSSIFQNTETLLSVKQMYETVLRSVLYSQRTIGSDICYLELSHNGTELGFRVLYEFVEQKMVERPRPIQVFVLRKYLWAFYKKHFLDPFLDRTWVANSYVRLFTTGEQFASSTVVNRVMGTQQLFNEWFDLTFARNARRYPSGLLQQTREYMQDTTTPALRLLPCETFTFLCRVMRGILNRLSMKKSDQHEWFVSSVGDVPSRHALFTTNQTVYEDSLRRFKEAKSVFMVKMHCKHLYLLSLSREGREFIRVMQQNPKSSMSCLDTLYYFTDQGYTRE